MTIEEIEYGSLASSTLLNNNFEDLQNQITALSLRISANASNLQTNTSDIADLASRVSALENQ
ncbi:TPA: hypothetical protein CPT98_07045 [Candidatus Gastranaerophilales bacterium HUM_19]|jgi:hypothetical protein|nr:MAG TPA: hypothetical protein CPT98_07045 [Candidatus Gastranaerophilales bacterium HUM_19]DAB19505.1 MAG TPA: hypothetical protein CPT97_01950 [Candidatus Gastranaerophilales bacterium HUM_17]DAB26095.1 MAG TPA: hypothetical protein CPT86_03670 [Candidatus Gastranaerophilales bacterium HUM_23]